MDIERNKLIKLVIVVLVTLAALAVMSIVVQLIQTVLPFLIIGAGVYLGYRWALGDAEAPTADKVQEQARGWFHRFRRTKDAVETTMNVGTALNEMQGKAENLRNATDAVVSGQATKSDAAALEPNAEAVDEAQEVSATDDPETDEQAKVEKIEQVKGALESNPKGKIEFKDSDVVISKDDLLQPDISRLQEKEKETPTVNDNVVAQVEERRRRLHGGK